MKRIGLVFAFGLLCLVASWQTGCSVFDSSGLNEAMQQYLTAIGDGDTNAFKELLPEERRFRFASYSETSGNLLAAESFTKSEVIQNLAERGGLYFALFGGDSKYRYRERINSAPLEDWSRILNVFRWHRGIEKTYVSWSKESDGWKVTEVGDSVP